MWMTSGAPIRCSRKCFSVHWQPVALLLALCLPLFLPAGTLDRQILRSVNQNYTRSAARQVNRFEQTVLISAVGVPLILLAYGRWKDDPEIHRHGMRLALSEISAYILAYTLKQSLKRNRPYQRYAWVQHDFTETDPSFPSGHATGSSVLTTYALLNLRGKPALKLAALIWSAGVGIGRIYQGLHYPSDILAGWAIGAGTTLLLQKVVPGGSSFLFKNPLPLWVDFRFRNSAPRRAVFSLHWNF